MTLNKEVGLLDNKETCKFQLIELVYEMIFIIYKHCEYDFKAFKLLKTPENHAFLDLASSLTHNSFAFDLFLNVKNDTDLLNFQKHASLDSQILFKVINRKEKKTVDRELDEL